jgi:hypothetical protein
MLTEGNSTSMCDKGSNPLPIPNSQETIGWWHLPKVELKYTLYGKAGAGSNPVLTTN